MKRYLVIAGVLTVIILALVVLNISFQRSLQKEMAEQFNNQQLLLAKTEASRIESYLSVIREDMLHVAQIAAVMNVTKESDFRLLTDTVCRHIGDIKRRVVFLDSQGEVRFTRGTMAIQELDDKYFNQAVKSGCASPRRCVSPTRCAAPLWYLSICRISPRCSSVPSNPVPRGKGTHG
jgi:hypothetical protein